MNRYASFRMRFERIAVQVGVAGLAAGARRLVGGSLAPNAVARAQFGHEQHRLIGQPRLAERGLERDPGRDRAQVARWTDRRMPRGRRDAASPTQRGPCWCPSECSSPGRRHRCVCGRGSMLLRGTTDGAGVAAAPSGGRAGQVRSATDGSSADDHALVRRRRECRTCVTGLASRTLTINMVMLRSMQLRQADCLSPATPPPFVTLSSTGRACCWWGSTPG